MRRLREILRLSVEGGLPQRAVAEALGIGTGTVSEYLGRARVAGVGWPIPVELEDDDKLETRVFGPKREGDSGRGVLDVAFVHEELRRPGVTLSLLWQEYLAANPGRYRYSQFCEHYHRYRKRLSPVMRQVHRAGEKAFVDFAGKRSDPRRRHLRPPHPWRIQDPHEGTVHAAGAGQGDRRATTARVVVKGRNPHFHRLPQKKKKQKEKRGY